MHEFYMQGVHKIIIFGSICTGTYCTEIQFTWNSSELTHEKNVSHEKIRNISMCIVYLQSGLCKCMSDSIKIYIEFINI